VAINYTGFTTRSEFSYNGLNHVVKIVEKTGSTINSTRKIVWCGNEMCEFRAANDSVTDRIYRQGQNIGNTSYYYTRDHLGSVRELAKSGGSTLGARYDYDPYGRSTTVLGTTPTDMNFTGLYRHSKSNLDLAVYRAYDPEIGRWLSRDPIAEAGGINLYSYVANDSLNRIDPKGEDFIFLNNSGSAHGLGHSAALVGSNTGGWTYYSKDGMIDGTQHDTLRVFSTYADFLGDPLSGGYDRAVHFKTDSDQDLAMTTYGDGHLRDEYWTLIHNCADFTSQLGAAGGAPIPRAPGPTIPNIQFWNISSEGRGKVWDQVHH
jgi:RHS repeat-associated protein